MEEREKEGIYGGIVWNRYFVDILENLCGCGGRKEIKKKEKGKEIINGDIFSNLENENIGNIDSRV